jgi:hypothetical protein
MQDLVQIRLYAHPNPASFPPCPPHPPPPLRRLVGVGPSPGCQGVQLVKEQDAWVGGTCARKQLPHRPLTLTHILVQQLWALHHTVWQMHAMTIHISTYT